jgi:hypothetical protein
MRKIVSGVERDTGDLELVAGWGFVLPGGEQATEYLYRLGDLWFLSFEDGQGFEDLISLTEGEAREWLIDTGCFETLERVFGERIAEISLN